MGLTYVCCATDGWAVRGMGCARHGLCLPACPCDCCVLVSVAHSPVTSARLCSPRPSHLPVRVGALKAAPEAVRQAVGGGCQSGWGRLLSVTNAMEAGTWHQGGGGGGGGGGQWLGIGWAPGRRGGGASPISNASPGGEGVPPHGEGAGSGSGGALGLWPTRLLRPVGASTPFLSQLSLA